MNSYTVYFEGYTTVWSSSEEEAKKHISENLDDICDDYEITDIKD